MKTNRVKEIREAKKLSRRKLAEMIDMSPSYIQFIETGERNPTITTAHKLAKALGVSIDDLFPIRKEA